MNLSTRIERLEKTHGNTGMTKLPAGVVLSPGEHAAFCLSSSPMLGAYDSEYAAKTEAFMRRHNVSGHCKQTDPAEMMNAMRLKVHDDPAGSASTRQRYRALIDGVFERCGFNMITAGA